VTADLAVMAPTQKRLMSCWNLLFMLHQLVFIASAAIVAIFVSVGGHNFSVWQIFGLLHFFWPIFGQRILF